MKASKTLTDEYRNADEDERVYLFLAHRELRREFIRIDYDEYQATFRARKSTDSVAPKSIVRRWLTALTGYGLKLRNAGMS